MHLAILRGGIFIYAFMVKKCAELASMASLYFRCVTWVEIGRRQVFWKFFNNSELQKKPPVIPSLHRFFVEWMSSK